jgi:hypothetical protein
MTTDPELRRARLELALVVLTSAAHFLFENVWHLKGPFIAVAGVSWLGYIAWRGRQPGQTRAWGFRTDTLWPSLMANTGLMLVSISGMGVYGLSHERGAPSAGFFYLLGLYPLWGLIQQFLLCALVAANLKRLLRNQPGTVLLSGVLFGLAHSPDWLLVGLTTVAACFWTAFYLRWPNLWVQGVAHGWLGAAAYFFVLGRDPWRELVESLQSSP